MSKDFAALSQSPWIEVDPTTWEIVKDLENNQWFSNRKWVYVPPSYKQSAIDLARNTTWEMCERLLCKITWWKRVRRKNNKWFDIILPDKSRLESKVWRTNKPAVIKETQLIWDTEYYGLMYYETNDRLPPSHFTSIENWYSPTENLKRNIRFRFAIILPKPVLIYYYNTSNTVRWVISSTWIAHRGISMRQAEKLFLDNPWGNLSFVDWKTFWKHKVEIMSLGYNLNA